MGKYLGNFEDIFDEELERDSDLSPYEQDLESKYWIHRTILPPLYFNSNYQNNDCPLVMTEEETYEYVREGKAVKENTLLSLFYSDEGVREDILKKLAETGLTEDNLECQIREKYLDLLKSFLEKGIYMPDVYGGDLERTAHQYSVKKMKRIIGRKNFGFNDNRGDWNIGIILEIPLEEQDKILETLETPIEYYTEYYGVAKISQVVSHKYIKGVVVKIDDKVMYIENAGFDKANEKNVVSENCPADAVREYIEEIINNQRKYIEEGKEVPKELLIPQEIVLSPMNMEFLLNSKLVDYVGAGETGNEVQFYWKETEKLPALELRAEKREDGKFILSYIREEASKDKEEFVWDKKTKEGKRGTIVVSKTKDALEELYDMDR